MNCFAILFLVFSKCSLIFAAFTNHWSIPEGLEREGRIVGGHEAAPHSHPYVVSLQMRFLWVRAHLCGGSLLNNYWVLTAGHCVKESWVIRWLPMDIVAGAHDVDKFSPRTQVSTVTQRIAHPLYDGGIGNYDIAVLKVSTPFVYSKEVQPVHLPINFKGIPDSMVLSGWGLLKTTLFFPALPSKLQEVNVTYVPYNECYKAVEALREPDEDNPLDEEANICTGPLTGGIAGCNGDSGGPLVQYVSSRKYDVYDDTNEVVTKDYEEYDGNEIDDDDDRKIPIVVGVVSWGVSPCGRKGAPTVYTRVSKYLDFINYNIKT